MNADAFLTGFRDNPDFLLQNLNFQSRLGLLVKINEATYRAASFLDERALTKGTQGAWFSLDNLRECAASGPAPPMPHYIAHVGYCGSTLISRLLAELPGNLPVREPTALLALAVVRRELGRPESWLTDTQWQCYYDLATRTLARTYRSGERAIIKLTSTAGNLLEPMLAPDQPVPRILLLYISLESLLAIMLRTPDMRDSLHADSPKWVTDFCRLTGRTDIRLSELDDAQQVAVKWLSLMLFFTRTASAHPAEAHMLNFDDFLQAPARELNLVTRHFSLGTDERDAERLVSSPLMQRYSKIPAQPFNPAQRTRELQAARQQFSEEIQAGLRWAEILCRETPSLDAAGTYLSNSS